MARSASGGEPGRRSLSIPALKELMREYWADLQGAIRDAPRGEDLRVESDTSTWPPTVNDSTRAARLTGWPTTPYLILRLARVGSLARRAQPKGLHAYETKVP
jgi:hypothetical protein